MMLIIPGINKPLPIKSNKPITVGPNTTLKRGGLNHAKVTWIIVAELNIIFVEMDSLEINSISIMATYKHKHW